MFLQKNKNAQITPQDLVKKVEKLEEELAKVTKDLEEFKTKSRKDLQKFGVIRFNPFGEIGGDQSFSVALLDQDNNGLVITSHYGRDYNHIYAKPLKGGKSEYALSEEEVKAIAEALKP